MDINRNNYELYLVDYAEDLLTPKQKQLVEAFLLANPDIQEEFDLFNAASEPLPETSFSAKNELKKIPFNSSAIDTKFFQQQCIASIEHLLNAEEEAQFQTSLSADVAKQKEYVIFQKTKLTLEHLHFDEKLLLLSGEADFTVTDENFTEYCVACLEGWLSQKGLIALNTYIANNPQLKAEFDFISQLKLTPDYNIIFPDKRKIKRLTITYQRPVRYLAAAASIAAVVIFSLFLWNSAGLKQQMQTATSYQIEQTTKTVENKIVNIDKTNHDMALSTQKQQTTSVSTVKTRHNKAVEKPILSNNKDEVKQIKPIDFASLDCKQCKNYEFDHELIIKDKQDTQIHESVLLYSEPSNNKNLLSNVVNTGLKGLSHLSNGKIKVKEIQNNRTNLTLSTKYLAFSTTIKTGR